MNHHELKRIIMHHQASSCITMHHHASSCIIMPCMHLASPCIIMRHHAPSCGLVMHHHASPYASIRPCIVMHPVMHPSCVVAVTPLLSPPPPGPDFWQARCEHLTVGSDWRNGKTEQQALTDEGVNSRVIMATLGSHRTGSRSIGNFTVNYLT